MHYSNKYKQSKEYNVYIIDSFQCITLQNRLRDLTDFIYNLNGI